MQERDRALKSLAKGAGIGLIGLLASKALTYIYRLIVARLGTEEYGLLSLGIVVALVLSNFSILGLTTGVMRYVSFYKGKKDESKMKGTIISALNIVFILSLISAVLLYLFADKISILIFHNSGLIPVLKIISIVIPFFSIGSIFTGIAYAFQKVEHVVTSKHFFEVLIKIILTIILIYAGYALFGAVVAYVLSIVASTILLFYLIKFKVYNFMKTTIKATPSYKKILSYSWPLSIVAILSLLTVYTDTLILGYFKPISLVGIYNAAVPTALLIGVVPQALLFLSLPILTELYSKNKLKDFRSVYKTATRWILLLNLPLFLLLFIFSKQIITILFGLDYVSASTPLIIIVVGYFVFYALLTSTDLLNVVKKTKTILLYSIIALTLNISLNIFLIPRYDMVGAATATSLSLITYALLTTSKSYKFFKITPFSKQYLGTFFPGIILSIPFYLIVKYFYDFSWTLYSLFVLFLLLLFFIGVYFIVFLRSLGKEDKVILRAIEKKLNIPIPKFLIKI